MSESGENFSALFFCGSILGGIAVAKAVKTLEISVRVGGLCSTSDDFNRCAVRIALAVAINRATLSIHQLTILVLVGLS